MRAVASQDCGTVEDTEDGPFAASGGLFAELTGWLQDPDTGLVEHGRLEEQLAAKGRELLRRLLQDHLNLRTVREQRTAVTCSDGLAHACVEPGHQRGLTSVFGPVEVTRLAYRRRGHANLHPADAVLNLPAEHASHGLRKLVAIEAARGSYEACVAAVERASGQHLGKRQVEQLAARAAADFTGFYATRKPPPAARGQLVVLSMDGKGVVMRPEGLRAATAKTAAASNPKLATRLSRGEKRGRKRMAEVGAVYHARPAPRTVADVLPATDTERRTARAGPTACGKWLTASVVADAATVVASVFDQACRRDPGHECTWVALVDGNNHQIDRVHAEAAARGITISVVCDFVHVLEYLWKAAWCFHHEGDPAAEAWVQHKARQVLVGHAPRVAAAIRRKATWHQLTGTARAGADKAADYLTRKAAYLDYPTALAAGWPIATGVIEGACRHLVKDRMDITGARWGLPGAEAVLQLRALACNNDFEDYWAYHLAQERQRLHESRFTSDPAAKAA